MRTWKLIWKEASHRKAQFALGILATALGAAVWIGAIVVLRTHAEQTEALLQAKEKETRAQMMKLEDDYRKITKDMGFNVLILPKNQKLGDLYADDFASEYMPEEYATRLANSDIVTVNHLLPMLQHKMKWPEQHRTVMIVGVRGEVPQLYRDPKKPILDHVPAGHVVLGHELHKSLGLEEGSKIKFAGRVLTVQKCYPERGNKDDITLWMNLNETQEMLGKQGLINAIMALECHCAGDRLAKIRAEIAGILPETQVIELATKAIARAETRDRAAKAAMDALASEKKNQVQMLAEQERLAAFVLPGVLLACVFGVGLFALLNARERRSEIGILQALGFGTGRILGLFLGRAALIGILGAGLGFLLGIVGGSLGGGSLSLVELSSLVPMFIAALLLCPLAAALATLLPALSAAQTDPALVLRDN